jgi:hypothetical protein
LWQRLPVARTAESLYEHRCFQCTVSLSRTWSDTEVSSEAANGGFPSSRCIRRLRKTLRRHPLSFDALSFLAHSGKCESCFRLAEILPANSRALGLADPCLLATWLGSRGKDNLPRTDFSVLDALLQCRPHPPLFVPVEGLSNRADMVLDDRIAATLRARKEENLLLNVRSEGEQGHDPRRSRRRDMADVGSSDWLAITPPRIKSLQRIANAIRRAIRGTRPAHPARCRHGTACAHGADGRRGIRV